MRFAKKIAILLLASIIVFVAGFFANIFLSFKLQYKNIVKVESKNCGVEQSIIYSIIKAESKFNKNAKSNAGAVGLMQIKLSSANYMLAQNGKLQITEAQLFVPETNIKLGTQYFAYLQKKFEDLGTAICAYNAGETVVRGWLKNSDNSTDGKTLKNIPFAETKKYLSKVQFNIKVYKKILNKN